MTTYDVDHYTFSEVLEIISQSVEFPTPTHQWQSNQLHRWIGEKHMIESGRKPGSGHVIVYNEKDIRRAIAYLRLRAVAGEAIGSHARIISDRVREVAAYHQDGYVFTTDTFTDPEDRVFWTETPYTSVQWMLEQGHAFVVIPCSVEIFTEPTS